MRVTPALWLAWRVVPDLYIGDGSAERIKGLGLCGCRLGWAGGFRESLECKMVMLGLRPGTEFGAEQAWELRKKFHQDGVKPSAACFSKFRQSHCQLLPSAGKT